MFLVWLLILSVLGVRVGANFQALPEYGIVITTTKTVLIPDGVILRVNDSTLANCFRLARHRPKRPRNE